MTPSVDQTSFTLTPEQQALLPTEEDIRSYEARGYYVTPKIIPEALLDAAIEGSERYYQGRFDDGPPIPSECVPQGEPYVGLRQHDYASRRCHALRDLISYPVVAATAARLARADSIRLWRDELHYKPPGPVSEKSTRVGWHRDRAYWLTCTSTNMLTAWIPFTDVTEDMGPLVMLDASNHWPFEAEDDKGFFDLDMEQREAQLAAQGYPLTRVPILLERGQVSFHSSLTLHGSTANVSARSRRSIAVHLQDGDNRYREWRLRSGQRASDWNVRLVRRDSEGDPDYADPTYCPTLWG